MKKLGIAAIIFTLLFVVFGVIGALMTAVGGVDIFLPIADKISEEIVVSTDEFEIPNLHNYGPGNFAAALDLDEVEEIVLFKGAVCGMTIEQGDTDQLVVTVKGDFTAEYLDKYSIGEGVDAIPQQGETARSPIGVNVSNGVLELSIDSDTGIRADYHIRVSIPADWQGSLCLNEMVSEVNGSNLTLDSLKIYNCTASVEFDAITINSLTVEECLSEVSVEGSIGNVAITQCVGEVDVDTHTEITGGSITENVGEISLSLPAGSAVDVDKSDNWGEVYIEGMPKAGGAVIEVKDNLGEIEIEFD